MSLFHGRPPPPFTNLDEWRIMSPPLTVQGSILHRGFWQLVCLFCSCSSFSLFCSNIPCFSFHLRAGVARKKRKPAPISDAVEGRFQTENGTAEARNVSIRPTSETKCWNQAAMSFAFDGSGASSVSRQYQQSLACLPAWIALPWGSSTETDGTACTFQPERGNARFDRPG